MARIEDVGERERVCCPRRVVSPLRCLIFPRLPPTGRLVCCSSTQRAAHQPAIRAAAIGLEAVVIGRHVSLRLELPVGLKNSAAPDMRDALRYD